MYTHTLKNSDSLSKLGKMMRVSVLSSTASFVLRLCFLILIPQMGSSLGILFSNLLLTSISTISWYLRLVSLDAEPETRILLHVPY